MKTNLIRQKSAILVLLATIVLGLSACNDRTSEVEELKNKVATLEAELDACANGAQRLLQSGRSAFDSKDYGAVVGISEKLDKKHPGTPETKEASSLAEKAKIIIAEEKKQKEERDAIARAEEEKKLTKEKEEKERQLARALANMTKKSDDMRDVIFYTHKAASKFINSRSAIEPYIAIDKSGNVILRLKNVYVADDWLFIESYRVKVDDAVYDIVGDYGDIERDNDSGYIWEWVDESVSSEREAMLRAIASSKKTLIRYNGKQYYKDRTIPDSEKKLIEEVLSAYEILSKTSR